MDKLFIISNSAKGLYNFRKELIYELKEKFDITIICSESNLLEDLFPNCNIISFDFQGRKLNVFKEISNFLKLRKLIKSYSPKIILTFTIKPNLYIGIIRKKYDFLHISNITGLGYTFYTKNFLIKFFAIILYKISLKKTDYILAQNKSIEDKLSKLGFSKDNMITIPGSGVNIKKFTYIDYPAKMGKINVLFIGRITYEKGLKEFNDLVELSNQNDLKCNFFIIGDINYSYKEIQNLKTKENVIFVEYTNDVTHYYELSHLIINPSHHEGMSNVLLEANACGRPCIASNIDGCKEIIENGVNGYLFTVNDSSDLFNRFLEFYNLTYEMKINMGRKGRQKVTNKFDRDLIISEYKKLINKKIYDLKG